MAKTTLKKLIEHIENEPDRDSEYERAQCPACVHASTILGEIGLRPADLSATHTQRGYCAYA